MDVLGLEEVQEGDGKLPWRFELVRPTHDFLCVWARTPAEAMQRVIAHYAGEQWLIAATIVSMHTGW